MNRLHRAVALTVAVALMPLVMAGRCDGGSMDDHRVSEHHARTITGIPSTITYDGNYDDIRRGERCYEGTAAQSLVIGHRTVGAGNLVQYCTDGWLAVQVNGDHFATLSPSERK